MSTIYDECSKDELLQIVYEMQKDLNDSKKENQRLNEVIKIKDNELKLRFKILTKSFLNTIFAVKGTFYADTDSIKETKDDDNNN